MPPTLPPTKIPDLDNTWKDPEHPVSTPKNTPSISPVDAPEPSVGRGEEPDTPPPPPF